MCSIKPLTLQQWVMRTIDELWRQYKCRIKRKHYRPYETDEERMQNHPENISEAVFSDLIAYWNEIEVQSIADTNAKNRQKKIDMHTTGPKSFATIYHKMQSEKESQEPPSLAEMYIAARKRKEGRTYKHPEDKILCAQIEEMLSKGEDIEKVDEIIEADICKERGGRVPLLGRGVTQKKLKQGMVSNNTSWKIPGECMESMTTAIKQEVTENVEKELQEKFDKKFNQEMQKVLSFLATAMNQLNPQANINFEQLRALVPSPSIPGDASSATGKDVPNKSVHQDGYSNGENEDLSDDDTRARFTL